MTLRLNPNKEKVDSIKNAISKNQGYCISSEIRDKEHLCICKDAVELGICKCGLYVITMND